MRHGAYEGHRAGYHAPYDAPLTKEGREQVSRAIPVPQGIIGIVTSPLPRAAQTAETVSRLSGLPILATSGLLAEWRAPSGVIGRTAADYPPAYVAWRKNRLNDPWTGFEDGESLTSLHERAGRAVAYLTALSNTEGGSLLAVSHKLLMGVLTKLTEGPQAFESATLSQWRFGELRFLHAPPSAQSSATGSARAGDPC
ncbi:histidine phosphatase family protein [Streptomyces mirabilis]|uniref:histidine phosphatase family protein n=1 Tax=Streptomyces sp. NPDC005388 TaxID=3156717 RepID=UPI0033A5A473